MPLCAKSLPFAGTKACILHHRCVILTYKGKPLVRKDNELYYGNMTDPYVLYLQIMTTKPVGDQQVADKVHLMLLSTDTTKAPQERVMRQTTKIGLYNALDIGSIWLQKANAQ